MKKALKPQFLNALNHVLLSENLFCLIETYYYHIVKYKQPPMHYNHYSFCFVSTAKGRIITK